MMDRLGVMAMGRRTDEQDNLFVTHQDLKMVAGHPFYAALDGLLRAAKFDRHVEGLCQAFYAEKRGRPSLAPGIYFRCLLVGFFEGIDSERGNAWRVADSLSLRHFLGLPMRKSHRTTRLCRGRGGCSTRRRINRYLPSC